MSVESKVVEASKKVTFEGGNVPTDVPDLPQTGFKYPVNKKSEEFCQANELPNLLDLIIPNLYLGDVSAAYDIPNLKRLDITHVLSIEDNSLDIEQYKHFEKYKFKKLADHQFSNILEVFEECLQFIDEAIKDEKNILVHCFAGKSRSATLVLAYIMSKEKQSVKKTLDQVRKRRWVKPNMGFYKQLELFQAMDFQVKKDSPVFRAFKLENIAKQIKLGNHFKALDKISGQNSAPLSDKNNNPEEDDCYKCKKCRLYLFPTSQVVPHIKSFEQARLNSWNKMLSYYKQLGHTAKTDDKEEQECRKELYIEPQDWFKERLEELNGKINCPKCDTKIGSFDWCGSKCSCETWVTPAFHISIGKVDRCKPLHASVLNADSKLLV